MLRVEEDYYLVALFLLLSVTWAVLRKLLSAPTAPHPKPPAIIKIPAGKAQLAPLLRAPSADEETLEFLDDPSSSEGTAEDQTLDLGEEEEEAEVSVNAPRFQFLSVRNAAPNSSPSHFYPNAREVQRFESDLVDGKVLLALRVAGYEDPYYASMFEGKKRTIQVQFQLRFKRKPRGVLYLGGELPRKMQLGLMTKGLCNVVIALVNKISSHGHASFGKISDNESETELPHIVFPLWSGATKLMLTKAGSGSPPDLGKEIEEAPEAKKRRKKAGFNAPGDIDEGDVLTFSMHTMYLDLVQWKMTNLGAIKDRDLGIFWGNMPLTIALYETTNPKVHRNKTKSYYLKVAIRNTWYQRTTEPPVLYGDEELEPASVGSAQVSDTSKGDIEKRSDSESDESTDIAAEDDSHYLPQEAVVSRFYVPAVVVRYRKQRPVYCLVLSQLDQNSNSSSNAQSRRTFVQELKSFTCKALPKCIVDTVKRAMKRLSLTGSSTLAQQLRAEINCKLLLDDHELTLPSSFFQNQPRLLQTSSRGKFGLGQHPWKSLDLAGEVLFEAPVIRALMETHWREEWLVVLRSNAAEGGLYLMLFRCASKKPVVLVHASSSVELRELDKASEVPFTDRYPAISVETVRRNFIVGFQSKTTRENFAKAFDCSAAKVWPSMETSLEDAINDSVDEDSWQWGGKRRIVVNAKQLYFGWRGSYRFEAPRSESAKLLKHSSNGSLLSLGSNGGGTMPSREEMQALEALQEVDSKVDEPTALQRSARVVEAALALKLAHENGKGVLEAEACLHDVASALKRIRMVEFATKSTPAEKLGFFLNIYNGLRIHSAYLLGQPSSMFGWSAFGMRMNYAVGSMVFSLNEIEHCIIRHNLNPPRVLISVAANETAYTKLFQTTQRDPRVNFCLNYGTKSSSTFIPVFRAGEGVEELLQRAAQQFLQEQMVVDMVKHKIKVPKICYWYGKDFTDHKNAGKKQKDYVHDVALAVSTLLAPQQQKAFDKIYTGATVRFRKFQWSAMREFA